MSSENRLQFTGITPVAPHGLGGLVRDHFANGRLFATVGAHGGLLGIGYWGCQHLGAVHFFKGDALSAWVKMFRVCVRINNERYYLMMNNSSLLPFGYTSQCEIDGVKFTHELILLADSVVQRARVTDNPQKKSIQFEMVHQEACTAVDINNRNWGEFEFVQQENALIVSCCDRNTPVIPSVEPGEDSLAQQGLEIELPDAPEANTWIGVGCDAALTVRRGFHRRSKYYLAGNPIEGNDAAYYVTFATDRQQLSKRLAELSVNVHDECDRMISNYEDRLLQRPRIDVGVPVLNSAFGQYPAIIDSMKIADRPGAIRATAAGYFVWGWDGMTPLVPCTIANDSAFAAENFRFFKNHLHLRYAIPHAFTSTFNISMKGPFPAQCQYIASLYHYAAITDDIDLVREVMPVCKMILDHCRRDEVQNTGLVSGAALWPDFPEAMEEDGNDINTLNNSLLYQALRGMEYLALATDDKNLADECGKWAKRLRVNFVKYLFDVEKGYFISSCSSLTLQPRKHYCCQAIYWITPFARELTSHAPKRISDFMDNHLRSDKCLLSLPHWDTAWMADGNQLGSSYPTSDYFYLNIHKIIGNDYGIKAWLGDVEWFWRQHTAPEAFTPEAENEAELGPDNPGCKQLQAVTCWYAGLYVGIAGMDFDHEGLTFTPWGDMPVNILGLKMRGGIIDVKINGMGNHIEALKVNGSAIPVTTRKIAWSDIKDSHAKIELTRTENAPGHPVILRADGLRISQVECALDQLSFYINGDISGEVVIQSLPTVIVIVDGKLMMPEYDYDTQSFAIPFTGTNQLEVTVDF